MAYKTVIGLEMHCELKSNSKVFSSAKNSFNLTPNDNIAPVDMAFPGTLPVLNKYCVENALMMAMVLNCKIPEYMYFDRKNYYYPDLPKGFQITQFHQPVGVKGYVDVEVEDTIKRISIYDIHLEEDAASLDHHFDTSCIDYNRAGIPLLELVTDPCISTKEEAIAFLEHMRRTYQYCDVSEADSKKGQIRCDVNVSIMDENDTELGTRVEIKNINSFGGVRDSIAYEIKRQSELKDTGRYNEVVRETRRWDEESGTTIPMRSKEEAVDYKLFVEPNLPKYKITTDWLEQIKTRIPTLPLERKQIYIEKYELSNYDASVLIKDKAVADYFEECIKEGIDPKTAANWVTVQILGYVNKLAIELKDIFITPKMLKFIIDKLNSNTISIKQAKEIFFKVLEEDKEPKCFLTSDMAQISDKAELEQIIDNILNENTSQVEAYKSGKNNLFDFFVGQVMKQTRGKANPTITKEILTKKLS